MIVSGGQYDAAHFSIRGVLGSSSAVNATALAFQFCVFYIAANSVSLKEEKKKAEKSLGK